MSSGRAGILGFDPSITAVAGATGRLTPGAELDQSGGGAAINSGTGPYYSRTTPLAAEGWSDVTDVIVVRGDLAGTMVAEVSNASDLEVQSGTDEWAVDTSISISAIAAPTTQLVVDTDPLDFSQTTDGSGTLTARVATTAVLLNYVAAGAGVGKTLTAPSNGAVVIDGVTLLLNDLVLVKDQPGGVDNGLYKLTTLGTVSVKAVFTRDTGLDQNAEAVPGHTVAVTAGTVNGTHRFILLGAEQIALVKAPRIGFGRYRLKFTRSSGGGTIKDRRVIKAS